MHFVANCVRAIPAHARLTIRLTAETNCEFASSRVSAHKSRLRDHMLRRNSGSKPKLQAGEMLVSSNNDDKGKTPAELSKAAADVEANVALEKAGGNLFPTRKSPTKSASGEKPASPTSQAASSSSDAKPKAASKAEGAVRPKRTPKAAEASSDAASPPKEVAGSEAKLKPRKPKPPSVSSADVAGLAHRCDP